MSAQVFVWAVWLSGAVAMFSWLLVNEWPTRREDARREGLPDHVAFVVTAFVVTSAAWFAVPLIRYAQRRN